ncbi:MAG: hypothetical protein HYT96_02250 [Armatimonadetes bacterium]|nr:hypothetical protein [Armatimonadota bacterium]
MAEAAEAVVRRLRGVQAVRVETDDNGGIRYVHVLGGPQRSPKVSAVARCASRRSSGRRSRNSPSPGA